MSDIFEEYFNIAMEAPTDITESVAESMKSMEEDVDSNTDENETNNDNNDSSEDEDETADDTTNEDDEDIDTSEDEDETADEDSIDDTDSEEDVPIDDTEHEFDRKNNVHKNTLRFLSIVTSNRESFEQRFGKVVSYEEIKDYHTILKAFDQLIEMTENILCTKFIDGSYNTLIKYYVALNRVYDIITRMTDVFVKTHIEEKIKTKK